MNIFVGFCFFSNEIFLDEGHLKVERTDLRGLAPVTLYIIHTNVFNAISSVHEKAAYFQYCFPQGTPRPRACRRHFLQLSHFQDTENQVCFFQICICLEKPSIVKKRFFVKPLHKMVTPPPSPFYEVPIYFFSDHFLIEKKDDFEGCLKGVDGCFKGA